MTTDMKPKAMIQIGDIVISSAKDSVQECTKQVKSLLRDKVVMKYLKVEQTKLTSYLS